MTRAELEAYANERALKLRKKKGRQLRQWLFYRGVLCALEVTRKGENLVDKDWVEKVSKQ